MKKLLLFLLLSVVSGFGAFTEFYCQTTGSNLNAGSSTADAALVTSTNGNWDGAAIFICGGATDLSGVTAGMFASVYNDGATVGVYVARITVVDDALDTITLSTTAKSGTAPTISATGRTIKVGGAWKGPNAAVSFPFNFVAATMTNAAADYPRVNLKNDASYQITGATTHSLAGPVVFQGYTATAGDLGKATIANVTTTASYKLFETTGANGTFADLIFDGTGLSSGTQSGTSWSASELLILRCVFKNIRGSGSVTSGTGNLFIECEAFLCNGSNTAGSGGLNIAGSGIMVRCISHDNAGSNSAGFVIAQGRLVDCISDTNGGKGILITSAIESALHNCDVYNNAGDGIDNTSASAASCYIESCNLIKNGGWGINSSGSSARNGAIVNCGFGSGTQVNTSGEIATTIGAMLISGSVTYATDVTPWADPANGDFRISLAAAKGTGRGSFTQTAASYAGAVAYPDIGAAQHQSTGGAVSYTFLQ